MYVCIHFMEEDRNFIFWTRRVVVLGLRNSVHLQPPPGTSGGSALQGGRQVSDLHRQFLPYGHVQAGDLEAGEESLGVVWLVLLGLQASQEG